MTKKKERRAPWKPKPESLAWPRGGLQWLPASQQYAWRGWVIENGLVVRREFKTGETLDTLAMARAERIIYGGAAPAKAKEVETFRLAAERIVARQGDEGMASAKKRRSRFERWIFPVFGHLRIDGVEPQHLREMLARAMKAGRSKSTLDHLRDDCSSILGELWRDGALAENVALKVQLPKGAKEDKRPRVVPSDAEVLQLLSYRGFPELHVAIICSREIGGQRTSDLLVGADWANIDTTHWTTWRVHRPKTDTWDEHSISAFAARVLESWWHSLGRPASGPVFPVRRGKRQGQRKSGDNSWAKVTREAFWRAGVRRPLPGYELAKTDTERRKLCAMQVDTAVSRKVEFHSTRRAYITALRRVNVDPSLSMKLAGHTEWRTHMRYDERGKVLVPPNEALLPISASGSLHSGIPGDIPTVQPPQSTNVPSSEPSGALAWTQKHRGEHAMHSTSTRASYGQSGQRSDSQSVILSGYEAPASEQRAFQPTAAVENEAWEADQHLQLTLSLRAAAISQREKAIAVAREAHATTRYSKDEAAALALTASPCGWTAEQVRNAAFGVTFHGFGKVTRVSPEGVES